MVVDKHNSPRAAAVLPPGAPAQREPESVWFEIGKALSFMLSILSLFPLVVSAFFEPGTHWQDRLTMSMVRIGLAACVCSASGLFFSRPSSPDDRGVPLTQTLPVRMFFWTLLGVALMFVLSWYLEAYFVPLLWRNQPYGMIPVLRSAVRLA